MSVPDEGYSINTIFGTFYCKGMKKDPLLTKLYTDTFIL
jgi:hypothetical protein